MPDEITIASSRCRAHAVSFKVTLRDGSIAAIRPAEQAGEAAWLALPGLVNLHAHADRAYTVQSFRPRSLADAVAAAAAARARFTAADVAARATRLFERSVEHGVTRMRTHTDVDPVVELQSMEGVLAAKQRMGERLDVDVIAFSTSKNDLVEPRAVERLERAVAMGADLIGASLNASADPPRALAALFDLAERPGLAVDLHLDEHLEPDNMLAGMVADAVIARGLQGRVTLSHVCVLAALSEADAGALIEKFARAQVTVVALPAANLFLQDRGAGEPDPARRDARPRACCRGRARPLRHRQCPGLVLSLRRRRHARDRAVRRGRGASRRSGRAHSHDLRRPRRDRGGRCRGSRPDACVFARRRLGATPRRPGRVQRRTAGRGRCCAGRGQIKGDVDHQGIADQVFLATDTAKLMREMGPRRRPRAHPSPLS